MRKTILSLTVASFAIAASSSFAVARDQIRIVGSSTVFPFTTAVAEKFGQTAGKTPVVESTGTGGGMKLFCAGVGGGTPDFTNASRAIKETELKSCMENGVTPVQIKVGFDGIVIANSKAGTPLELTKKQIFMALARQLPDASGNLVDNPNLKWSDIDPSLPDAMIEVLGPPPTSGTRDAFVELAMEGGAKAFESLAALRKSDKKAFKKVAHAMREDGAFIEAGENDNLIVQKLEANPNAFGIFGFSFLDQNANKLKGAKIDGEFPTFEKIAAGDYGVSRSLFIYAKKEHVGVIPGMAEFITEYTSDNAWGPDGYLADKGLIPLPDAERETQAKDARELKALSM